ncbi:glutathione S-transferase family protein [Conexibacter sp. SYSU D00693]|uniref:glutathione S-transferase family protein n=1 Tax=Conexibacter sp. SYSU D00693 TaxID=2812560 RepID=UPI00196A55AA|nr:glutathione S-transferase family protein [Conexibacter sp. SYSU D00693]
MPQITLHVLPPSHPSHAAELALKLKGLEFEKVELQPGPHVQAMADVYGEGRTTVPGMVVDGEAVHGSIPICRRLEELAPEPTLYPSQEVLEAEEWAERELQPLGRRLPWGALWFRPEHLSLVGGATEPLDPAGTDFAMKVIRATWKYHGLTAVQVAEALEALPGVLDRADALAEQGLLGEGDRPTGAGLQVGSTLRVLHFVGDLHPLLAGRPSVELGARWFPHPQASVPAGALPAGWVPQPA